MHCASLGKGRPGCGTQSLEKCELQAHLLLCNIAVLGEYHYSAKIHPVQTWLCELSYMVKLLSPLWLQRRCQKLREQRAVLPGAHPSLACSCSPTRTSFLQTPAEVSVIWIGFAGEPCSHRSLAAQILSLSPQRVPWEAWGAFGGYCGVSLLARSGQGDVTLPWTWFELRAGFLVCHCVQWGDDNFSFPFLQMRLEFLSMILKILMV